MRIRFIRYSGLRFWLRYHSWSDLAKLVEGLIFNPILWYCYASKLIVF
jgi:hypothetical protein